MSKRGWIIFVAIVVILFGTLIYFSGRNRVEVGDIDATAIQPAREASGNIGDHVFGNPDSKVVLIEYGDFQCPGCGGAHPTVKTLSEKYEDDIAFVYRNFPLTSIHQNARFAAAAAEAAGLQDAYWPMHNRIFETQNSWENLGADERSGYFINLARDLGLDTEAFTSAISDPRISQKINFDQSLARKVGVNSTPTFYLNGTLLEQDTWGDDAAFEAAIVAELKAQGVETDTQPTE